MMNKMIYMLPLLIFIAGCSSLPEKPTQPVGKPRPINTLATAETLAHQAGYIVVGEQRDNEEYKRKALNQPLSTTREKRQLFRNLPTSEFAYVPGAELIERTVNVPFAFASADFNPTPAQMFHLRVLFSVADRIEVRGRTDGKGNQRSDERMAHRRAEAAKRYLLNRGVPSEIISINYQAAGDYIADNETLDGRNMNRRVEIEFFIDDFTRNRPVEYVAHEVNACNQPITVDEWQVVGSEPCINEWGKKP